MEKRKPSHPKRGHILTYQPEAMEKALEDVKSKKLAIRKASKTYDVPRTTLLDKLRGRTPEERRMGPDTVLSIDEENTIEDWLVELAKCGFPRKKTDLLSTIKKIVKSDNRKTPFKNFTPGDGWYRGFMKRHPLLSERTSEPVTSTRARVTEETIRSWFKGLTNYLTETRNNDILNEPNRVFNADETNFQLCPRAGKVIGVKGWKNVYDVTGSEKNTLTVLATICADGSMAPGMIVYPYKVVPRDVANSVPEGWAIGRSDSGWMKSETFYEYIANVFVPYIDELNVKRPVLFYVDGHQTHLTQTLSQFCSDHGVILYSFHANATHILQPCDVSLFRPIKQGWRQITHQWKNDNPHKVLTKTEFAPLLDKVVKERATRSTIQNGFRACGLVPLNPSAVEYSKCLQTETSGLSPVQNSPQSKSSYKYALRIIESQLKEDTISRLNSGKPLASETALFEMWKSISQKSLFVQSNNETSENHDGNNEVESETRSLPANTDVELTHPTGEVIEQQGTSNQLPERISASNDTASTSNIGAESTVASHASGHILSAPMTCISKISDTVAATTPNMQTSPACDIEQQTTNRPSTVQMTPTSVVLLPHVSNSSLTVTHASTNHLLPETETGIIKTNDVCLIITPTEVSTAGALLDGTGPSIDVYGLSTNQQFPENTCISTANDTVSTPNPTSEPTAASQASSLLSASKTCILEASDAIATTTPDVESTPEIPDERDSSISAELPTTNHPLSAQTKPTSVMLPHANHSSLNGTQHATINILPEIETCIPDERDSSISAELQTTNHPLSAQTKPTSVMLPHANHSSLNGTQHATINILPEIETCIPDERDSSMSAELQTSNHPLSAQTKPASVILPHANHIFPELDTFIVKDNDISSTIAQNEESTAGALIHGTGRSLDVHGQTSKQQFPEGNYIRTNIALINDQEQQSTSVPITHDTDTTESDYKLIEELLEDWNVCAQSDIIPQQSCEKETSCIENNAMVEKHYRQEVSISSCNQNTTANSCATRTLSGCQDQLYSTVSGSSNTHTVFTICTPTNQVDMALYGSTNDAERVVSIHDEPSVVIEIQTPNQSSTQQEDCTHVPLVQLTSPLNAIPNSPQISNGSLAITTLLPTAQPNSSSSATPITNVCSTMLMETSEPNASNSSSSEKTPNTTVNLDIDQNPCSSATSGSQTSTAFQKHLFWPGKKNPAQIPRSKRIPLPHAVSSNRWKQHYNERMLEARTIEDRKAKNKEDRINKRKEKDATIAKKKSVKEGRPTSKALNNKGRKVTETKKTKRKKPESDSDSSFNASDLEPLKKRKRTKKPRKMPDFLTCYETDDNWTP